MTSRSAVPCNSWLAVALMVATLALSTTTSKASEIKSPTAIESWRTAFIAQSASQGVSRRFLIGELKRFAPDPEIIALSTRQPELRQPIGDYIATRVSTRITEGQARLAANRQLLERITATFGVPGEILIAIWGLETTYGTNLGRHDVIRSLATLASANGRRAAFWARQLLAACRIAEARPPRLPRLVGSWAGAIGHTQFIPTTFEAFAVDFDGDAIADLSDSHADALASAANYLKLSGWPVAPDPQTPSVAIEVRAGPTFEWSNAGRKRFAEADVWRTRDVRRSDGTPLPQTGRFAFIAPQGAHGPQFLVTPAFNALLRYNNAVPYALAVTYLAEAIADRPDIAHPWRAERPLTRNQRKMVQERLVARGYDTGGIDGILGDKSAAAIRNVQRRHGQTPDGHANAAVLKLLAHRGFPHLGEET
ncbi:MAG: lytic murein transglycosylase [Pseudomonadota bacterium]